jgi:hypothetical protein
MIKANKIIGIKYVLYMEDSHDKSQFHISSNILDTFNHCKLNHSSKTLLPCCYCYK